MTATTAEAQAASRQITQIFEMPTSRQQVRGLVDLYYLAQRVRIGTSNHAGALARSGEPNDYIAYFAGRFGEVEDEIKPIIERWARNAGPAAEWALGVKGIGPILVAGLFAHIDITKARTAGNIWSFAGLNPSVKWEKGQKRPWNADLKRLCVHPDCLILTQRGAVAADDVRVGDMVLTHQGNWKPVTQIFRRYFEGDLVGLRSRGRTAWVTPDHPVFAGSVECWPYGKPKNETRQPYDWHPARDVKHHWSSCVPVLPEGGSTTIDFAALPGAIDVGDGFVKVVGRWEGVPHQRSMALPAQVQVDEEMAYWFGLYVAEGHVTGNRIGFSFHEDETDLITAAEKGFARFGVSSWVQRNDPNRSVQVCGDRHLLAAWLVEHCGANSHGARVPPVIWLGSDSVRAEFLRGYHDGDGDHGDGRPWVTTTVSGRLAAEIAALNASVGYWSSIRNQGPFKVARLNSMKPPAFNEPQSMPYAGPVVNFEVADDNSYTVEGLAMHNCWLIGDSFVKVSTAYTVVELEDPDGARRWYVASVKVDGTMKIRERVSYLSRMEAQAKADSLESFYGRLYRERKALEVARNEAGDYRHIARQTLQEKNIQHPETKRIYESRKLPPGRLDLRARRWSVKIFLAHLHEEMWREHYGTEPPAPYPIAYLGHVHKIEVPRIREAPVDEDLFDDEAAEYLDPDATEVVDSPEVD